jgi:predicted O-linked N-acetylglucosamine transferase (SPINDLY family)
MARQTWTPAHPNGQPMKVTQKLLHTIWRAQLLYDKGDYDACEPLIRKVIKHKGMAQALSYDALGSCIQYQGKMRLAISYFRKALALDPDYVEARNRIIMILDAMPETTAEDASRERKQWWAQHGVSAYARRRPPLVDRQPDRPLRVGYVSADFQYHSAATVFHRIVTEHSEAIQPFLYSSTKHHKWDQITNTYRAMPGWRDIVDWPDLLVVEKIRDDKIDILVDLSNFTADNRLGVFASKPAPGAAHGIRVRAGDWAFRASMAC